MNQSQCKKYASNLNPAKIVHDLQGVLANTLVYSDRMGFISS
jgi:hypothetical protein